MVQFSSIILRAALSVSGDIILEEIFHSNSREHLMRWLFLYDYIQFI